MTRAPLARVVAAATLVAAAAVVLGPTTPASAASCTSGSGVTVVVDPGALGVPCTAACDSGSGQAASARYADVGVALSYVQRQPGFVCRVNGAPASDPCVNTPPADAYWGLWWSDGEGGTWRYPRLGVTGLQVPDGGRGRASRGSRAATASHARRRRPRPRGARADHVRHQHADQDPDQDPDARVAHHDPDHRADLVRSGAPRHAVDTPPRPSALAERVGERVRPRPSPSATEPQPAPGAAGHADAAEAPTARRRLRRDAVPERRRPPTPPRREQRGAGRRRRPACRPGSPWPCWPCSWPPSARWPGRARRRGDRP